MSEGAVRFFTTGGTIDKVYFDALSEFQVGPTAIDDMLRDNNVQAPVAVTSLMRKDSLELTDADRAKIAKAVGGAEESQIVITHGTDTMVQTARVLMDIAGKTIVLTGALQPATIKHSDAEFNVGFALAAAQALPAGVYIAMNGQIFDPAHVRKDRDAARFVLD